MREILEDLASPLFERTSAVLCRTGKLEVSFAPSLPHGACFCRTQMCVITLISRLHGDNASSGLSSVNIGTQSINLTVSNSVHLTQLCCVLLRWRTFASPTSSSSLTFCIGWLNCKSFVQLPATAPQNDITFSPVAGMTPTQPYRTELSSRTKESSS